MVRTASSFFLYLDLPIGNKARLLLVALVFPLLLSFGFPLWRISMTAPQYPAGLSMDIYSYKVEGGNEGRDVKEINTLNHYIGMHTITREELRDLDWIPFALVGMALLALRSALLGNVRTLIDLSVLAAYICAVAFARFVYMLYEFGHNLDPKAPMEIAPFMPVVFGSKQVANFMTHSYPQLGSGFLFAFTVGLWLITAQYLLVGRKEAKRQGLIP